ncbi:MAG: alpha/beta hydrolase-fold protein [Bacteroidota bacterium]
MDKRLDNSCSAFYSSVFVKTLILIVLNVLFGCHAFGQVDTHILYSKQLGDSVQYFTYTSGDSNEPISGTIYMLDGKKMIENGLIETIKKVNETSESKAYRYIFVSSIVNGKDKREDYFSCNPSYVSFFEDELIPLIEKDTIYEKKRALMGASFGGLCAAYFATKSQAFTHYVLLSPITYLCKDLHTQLAFSKNIGLNIYISSGKNDAERYVRSLVKGLQAQQHTITEVTTERGHDFENWKSQLGQIIEFFKKY